MGQQQLLLLVIGIVIVGLAVVVGIQQVGEHRRRAEIDALSTDAVRMATGAAAWRTTPRALGGGQGATSFAGFGLTNLGFRDIILTDAEREVAFDGTTFHSVWARTGSATYVAVINAAYDAQAAVFLYGPGPECLAMRTGRLVGSTWTFVPSETPPRPTGCTW